MMKVEKSVFWKVEKHRLQSQSNEHKLNQQIHGGVLGNLIRVKVHAFKGPSINEMPQRIPHFIENIIMYFGP